MAKVLSQYRGYLAAEINSRASNTCTHSVVGSTVECIDVMMSKVKNILGASTYSLYDLCRHDNVNQWSAFSPRVMTITAGVLTLEKPTVCKLGDFAGYNHAAEAPAWYAGGEAAATADLWVNAGGTATFICNYYIGELRYNDLPSGAMGVMLIIEDDLGTIYGYQGKGFTADAIKSLVNMSADVSGMSVERTYTCKLAIVNDLTGYDGSQFICYVPNITGNHFHRTVKIKATTDWWYEGLTKTIPSPWVQNGTAGFAPGTGIFDIGWLNSASNLQVKIQVKKFNWLNELVSSGYIVGDDSTYYTYNAMDDILGTVDLGVTDAYGYTIIVYFSYFI